MEFLHGPASQLERLPQAFPGSCPIALYPASSSTERVAFRQISKKTGNRLKQQLIDSDTGDAVDSADKGRGYEVGKNEFILVEDEELEAVRVESTHTIEIDTFVPREQIDLRYLDSPYYIAPTDQVGQEAFAVIREAMRGKDMVAIGRVVLARRERPIALEPFGKGLRAITLRYPYEVRNEAEYFADIPDIKIPEAMLELAEHILDSKATDFDPSRFEDHYQTAVVDMLKRKQAGMPAKAEAPAPSPRNVVNLMDALKRSIEMEGRPPAQSARERLRDTITKKKPEPASTARTARAARTERNRQA